MKKNGIIFDLDGTLWDASRQVVPAWNIALNRHNELDKQIRHIQRNELKKAVYVGDTIGDLEAANYADTPFIYASYGFGQLNDVKYSINNISDINRIVCNII
jgi:phosphoglycolate phosphatase-like HAD superfamily hydrolase